MQIESRSKEIAWEDKEKAMPSWTGQRERIADQDITAITWSRSIAAKNAGEAVYASPAECEACANSVWRRDRAHWRPASRCETTRHASRLVAKMED
jgi:hypothetical protein